MSYLFIFPEEHDKLQLHHFETEVPARICRPFARSTSEKQQRPLSIEKMELQLSYLVGDVFLYKEPTAETFNYLYDRMRELLLGLRDKSELYQRFYLSFLTLVIPLFVKQTIPDDQARFQTYQKQSMMWLRTELRSQCKRFGSCASLLCLPSYDTTSLLLERMWNESDFAGLELEIRRICAVPSRQVAVAAAWLTMLAAGSQHQLDSFGQFNQLAKIVPEQLQSSRFILECLACSEPGFEMLLRRMASKEGQMITWNPFKLPYFCGRTKHVLYIPSITKLQERFSSNEEEPHLVFLQEKQQPFCVASAAGIQLVDSKTTTPEPPQKSEPQQPAKPQALSFTFAQKIPSEQADKPKFSFPPVSQAKDVGAPVPASKEPPKPVFTFTQQTKPAAEVPPIAAPQKLSFSFSQPPKAVSESAVSSFKEQNAPAPSQENAVLSKTPLMGAFSAPQQPARQQTSRQALSIGIGIQLTAQVKKALQKFGLELLAEKLYQKEALEKLTVAPQWRAPLAEQRSEFATPLEPTVAVSAFQKQPDQEVNLQTSHDEQPVRDLTQSTIFDQGTVREIMAAFRLE